MNFFLLKKHFKLNIKKTNQEYFILDWNDDVYIIFGRKDDFSSNNSFIVVSTKWLNWINREFNVTPSTKRANSGQDVWCLNWIYLKYLNFNEHPTVVQQSKLFLIVLNPFHKCSLVFGNKSLLSVDLAHFNSFFNLLRINSVWN